MLINCLLSLLELSWFLGTLCLLGNSIGKVARQHIASGSRADNFPVWRLLLLISCSTCHFIVEGAFVGPRGSIARGFVWCLLQHGSYHRWASMPCFA
jgi:hypothetical protein